VRGIEEVSIQLYEIRILDEDGKTALIASEVRLNDSAAIRSARVISGSRKFEVWRGMDCIYGMGSAPLPEHPGVVIIDFAPP